MNEEPHMSDYHVSSITRRRFLEAGGVVAGGMVAGIGPLSLDRVTQSPGVTRVDQPATGISVSVASDGAYTVTSRDPEFEFGGTVGHTLHDVRVAGGADGVGPYREITFDYEAGVGRTSGIRAYANQAVVLFTTTYNQAGENAEPFPILTTYPRLAYQESFGGCQGAHRFTLDPAAAESPWLFFDGAAEAFLLSPASHFPVARTRMVSGEAIESRIDPAIDALPAGLTYSALLAIGTGVNNIYETWGRALTDLHGKARPDNDQTTILDQLGYWTDHGAVYYYNFDRELGYAGTLKAVKDSWDANGIPMGYMQLDSWFYPKGPDALWNPGGQFGTYRYEAAKDLFPDDLEGFQAQVGVPLVTHARWIDPSSPYHDEYEISGEIVTDPRFWDDRMRYLREGGVVTFEQDWLCRRAQPAYNLTDRDAYLDNMASAAAANGLDIQYCLALPRDFLQTAKYSNVTNIRVSQDRFGRNRWDSMLYTSRLAAALGVWPWSDVFMSTETRNLLLSVLSAGPVGVGDAVGAESRDNLLRVARPDGVLVKPDAPIVPTDNTHIADARGDLPAMVASTYSEHSRGRSLYIYAYAREIEELLPEQVYQAEEAILNGPIISSMHSGYTGRGYIDYRNQIGEYIEWTVQSPSAGTYTLLFRYANGSSTERPLAVAVNGTDVDRLPFGPTGSGPAGWRNWLMQTLTVQLSSGANTVRATTTIPDGPNIDYLGVTAGVVELPTQSFSFTPTALGVPWPAYVYDYFADTGRVVGAGETFSDSVDLDGSYYVVAPLGRSGIALLGDTGKFVTLGKKRIPRVVGDLNTNAVQATVAFAEDETDVTLRGYSAGPVRVNAGSGSVDPVTYDPATGLFTVSVHPTPNRTALITITAQR